MDSEKYIDLKDVSFTSCVLVAYGKVTIPATLQTPEMYALSIYLRGFQQPLVVTYTDISERDAELAIIKQAVTK